jgi:methionyl-tRNA formyltransferase
MTDLRIGFAGDRDIAVWVLTYLLQQGTRPQVLLLSGPERASHGRELRDLCPFLPENLVWWGQQFREPAHLAQLQQLELDYLIGIHFPYIIPDEVLTSPRFGVLNLHPAYLPYNRGWHTPSWALLEQTPIGATLHFMTADVDMGDIIHRKQLIVSPGDTADTLYHRLKQLELELFQEAWPQLVNGTYQRLPQLPVEGSTHKRKELFTPEIQRIALDEQVTAGDLIRRLRALTTNQWPEAAYYEMDGKRFHIQVVIQEVVE